jgi:FolB domain-containing protein
MTANPQTTDTLKVILRDCMVDLYVGIHKAERLAPQPVLINVVIETRAEENFLDPKEMKLDRVINYENIYEYIQNDLCHKDHVGLLECVAEHIISFCFRDERVKAVTVRIEKTQIFSKTKGVGVEIQRHR